MKKIHLFALLGCVGIFLLFQPAFAEGQSQGNRQGQGSGQGKPQAPSLPNAFNAMNDSLNEMDKAFAAEEEPTLEDEYYLGRAVAANILSVYKPYTRNTALTQYVNRICQTLVINSSQPEIYNGYHVIILDSAEFNAFATPGGHIFLTKGLVEAAPSEDALAGVIAHELSHIMLRHAMNIIRDTRIGEVGDNAAAKAANLSGNSAAARRVLAFRNSVSGVVDTMLKSGFSQDQEFGADKNAVALLAAAGYDPKGLTEMLQVLQRVQNSQRGGFNSTHPGPAARLANVNSVVVGYRVQDTRSYRTPRFKNK